MVVRQRSPSYSTNSSSTPLSTTSSHSSNSISLDEIEAVAMDNETDVPDVPWKNTFNMRPLTLSALSTGRPFHRSSQNPLNRMRCRGITSAAKSLDILRQNLQATINKEIDLVIKKYLETFFEPAVKNVRRNLGPNSVSEDLVRDVCRTMLEEAKQMYCAGFTSVLHRGLSPLSDSEIPFRPTDQVLQPRKRKSSDTDSESSIKKRSSPQITKWDPNRLTKETPFILSTTAGKCLGLGSLRGRLFVKHPDLVRYNLDQEDREWLTNARVPGITPVIPSTYLMFLEDIVELAQTEEYRSNPNLMLSELRGFEIPEFIQKKVRAHLALMRAKHVSSQSSDSSEVPSSVGFGVECVSSTMTPPSILDSELVELQSPFPNTSWIFASDSD